MEMLLSVERGVALFTRAWIEIATVLSTISKLVVALFTRAWIEITWNIYL